MREAISNPSRICLQRLLYVAHLAVFEDHLHSAVVVDDLGSEIRNPGGRAKSRLHLVSGLAQFD